MAWLPAQELLTGEEGRAGETLRPRAGGGQGGEYEVPEGRTTRGGQVPGGCTGPQEGTWGWVLSGHRGEGGRPGRRARDRDREGQAPPPEKAHRLKGRQTPKGLPQPQGPAKQTGPGLGLAGRVTGVRGAGGGARRTRTAPDYLHSAEWPEPRPRPGPASAVLLAKFRGDRSSRQRRWRRRRPRRRLPETARAGARHVSLRHGGGGAERGPVPSFQGRGRGVAMGIPEAWSISPARPGVGDSPFGRSVLVS